MITPGANGYDCLTQPANVTQSDYERAVCAHAEYFSALVEREGARLEGAGFPDGGTAQRHALRLLAREQENIYEGLYSALQRRSQVWLLRIAGKLARFLFMKGDSLAAHDISSRLLAAAGRLGSPQLELQARFGLGLAQSRLGSFKEARETLSEARRLALELGNRIVEAYSLGNLAVVHQVQGDYPLALEMHTQALTIRRELGDRHGEAKSLSNLGTVHHSQGDYSVALELQTQALAIRRELGDRQGEAYSLANLAIVHHDQGNYPLALELQTQALAIRRELGDRSGEAYSLGDLAIVHYDQGDYPLALELQTQALAIRRELNDRHGTFYSCLNSAATLAAVGQHRPATVLLQGAQAAAAALGLGLDSDDQQVFASASARLDAAVAAGKVSAADLARWQAEGEALSLDELAEFTLAALREAQ